MADGIEVVDNLTNHLDSRTGTKVNRDLHALCHAGIVASR
jgi:ABC-type ATPase with predicted acetyltransferase domain